MCGEPQNYSSWDTWWIPKVLRPLEEKVQAIVDFPQPTSLRKHWEFLGLINFYHRFIPKCADILQPLNALLSSTTNNSKELAWTEAGITAFMAIKEALATATLMHPKLDAPTSVVVDASDTGVGAVLQQHIDCEWCPISFFSTLTFLSGYTGHTVSSYCKVCLAFNQHRC